jgi:hypothetical protein
LFGHNHYLYTIDNNRNIHYHFLSGITSYNDGHSHKYEGQSDVSPNTVGHIHYYSFYTSYENRHTHLIYGDTGPAVYLPNGEHYHLFEGQTTIDGLNPHSHRYYGRTSL